MTPGTTSTDLGTVSSEEWRLGSVVSVGELIGENMTTTTHSDLSGVSQMAMLLSLEEESGDLISVESVLGEDVFSGDVEISRGSILWFASEREWVRTPTARRKTQQTRLTTAESSEV